MHIHFERNLNAKCDCNILSLSWMGQVPDELPEAEGWKLNRNNYYQEGWLATGNIRGIVGVTYTTSHGRRMSDLPNRTNYNLRGHRSDVVLVKWNEPYQKLASCDSSGVIFVWIKYEGRWSIELINDRNTPVTHFSWSHDGRMALICYQDGFVLVGSVAGQRYWSSMLTLDARITCGCWTPDDAFVYLGTAAGQLVVMDVHGAMVSQVQLNFEGGITSMTWSCEKFKMEEIEGSSSSGLRGIPVAPVVPGAHVLAVAFGTGEVVILRGHDDVTPTTLNTQMLGGTVAMEWASSRDFLAVAGSLSPDKNLTKTEGYLNVVKFYSEAGVMLHIVQVPYTECFVTGLTWGHLGRRLFISVGRAVCTARVWRDVAPLQLLSRVRVAQSLSRKNAVNLLPLPNKLKTLIAGLFVNTIRCIVPEPWSLRAWVSRPPSSRLYCSMLRHVTEDMTTGYTLYLEHLGGLVPLLKGRRISKIRPEFVIYDPQLEGCDDYNIRGAPSTSSGSTSSSLSSSGVRSSPRGINSSDSSESEHDEGCSGSPRMQRRRRKVRVCHKKDIVDIGDNLDDLAYVDTLPEEVRLVHVTSNIWGTKFKLHGLGKNIPANLGQVTYKTSLLHLQPRQMTVSITELRDDYPVAPDPTFNPHVFSEDEEEINFLQKREKLDKNYNYKEEKVSQIDYNENPISAGPSTINTIEAIQQDNIQIEVNENIGVRRVSTSATRNAVSPLRCDARCDGSIPTLQSPKNAVAPTDIIFERPSPQAVACGGRNEFYGGARSDFGIRSEQHLIKASIERIGFDLRLDIEPRQPNITNNKPCNDNNRTKNKKSSNHRNESVLTKPMKSSTGHVEGDDEPAKLASSSRADDISFIDDTPSPVFPISVADSTKLSRSSSVGCLDIVSRTPINKRLVLVSRTSRRGMRERFNERIVKRPHPVKSKSLDSGELSIAPQNEADRVESDVTAGTESIPSSDIESESPKQQPEVESRRPDSTYYESSSLFLSCLSPRFKRRSRRDTARDCKVCKGSYSGSKCTSCHLNGPKNKIIPPDCDKPSDIEYMWLESLVHRLSPRRSARSSPASPVQHRQRRHCSASPIRQILNSPLLNRKRNKKTSESSDDELLNNNESIVNGRNYKNLESFQKAQLRNKLKRGKAEVSTSSTITQARQRQLVMYNKAPMWNENSQVYQLDFGGRVTQESAKNFQIEFHGKQVMQFGRIDGNAYTLDFQYPFSAIQAFAVALANVTQRLK